MTASTLRYARRSALKVVRDVKHRGLGLPWMEVEPRDCFLASWPRSGNTWLRHILYFYLTGRDEIDMTGLERFAPIIDRVDLKAHLAAMGAARHRFIKTHETGAGYFTRGRIVYLVRDGRDATWSYHKFRLNLNPGTPASFDAFLRRCLDDRIRYRSWHTNVATWMALKDDPAMMVLRFEDMRADPRAAFERILAHLNLPVAPERVDRALALATPERVNATFASQVARGAPGRSQGQGGVVERWRTTYSPEQLALFEARAGTLLKELGYATVTV